MLQKALEQMNIEALPGPAIPRVGETAEVAQLVAFLLSDNSKFISGTDVSIDGAWIC
jgi:NAD(P)-dependent dehydrogenase (short-subunit alcohol dehydrogenase family)